MYLYRKAYLGFEDKQNIKEALGKETYKKEKDIPEGFKLPTALKDTLEKLENCAEYNEEVAYWRKANAIHGWFVRNCESIREDIEIKVTYQDLQNLLKDVNEVLENTVLEKGKIHIGTVFRNGKRIEEYEDGLIVKDSSIAEELLPTTEGFFFGSYDYDEYYIQDLKDTQEVLTKILKESSEYDEFLYYASY